MRHRVAFVLLAVAGAGCHSLDTTADRAALASEVDRRAGTGAVAPSTDLDPAVGDAVMSLLRAPLDSDRAVQIALLNNHQVRATYQLLGIARADLVQAGLLRNPVFDGDARFLFDGGTELEIGLAQPFVDLFYRPLRSRLAEHEFARAQLLLTNDLLRLVFAVRRALVEVVAMNRLAELQRAAVQVATAAHELAGELHRAGNITDQALAGERVAATRARLDLHAAEQRAREAREPLQQLLGLWGAHTDWTPADVLTDEPLAGIDLQHVETRAVAASLDLAAHRAGLQALAQQAELDTWRGWLPDGEFGISALREPGGEWGLGPHVALELPVLDGGSARREKSQRRLGAGLHDFVQLAVEVRSLARRLRDRAGMLAERVRFQRDEHLPARAEVVRTTLQTYNAMQIGAFAALSARRQQVADQQEHLLTLFAAHLARLDLQELLAGRRPATPMPSPAAPGNPADEPKQGHE